MQVEKLRLPRFLWSAAATALLVSTAVAMPARAQSEFDAGKAVASGSGSTHSLGNRVIEARWNVAGTKLANLMVTDRLHQTTIAVPSPFSLLFADGSVVRMEDLHFIGALPCES